MDKWSMLGDAKRSECIVKVFNALAARGLVSFKGKRDSSLNLTILRDKLEKCLGFQITVNEFTFGQQVCNALPKKQVQTKEERIAARMAEAASISVDLEL